MRLDNLALIGPVVDAGLKAGANQLEGVHFSLRNELPSQEQALKQAVNEARTKAQAMASALNVGIVDVLEISEGGVSLVPRGDFAMPMMTARVQSEMAPTPVSPGEIEVHASVTIRYRISQKP